MFNLVSRLFLRSFWRFQWLLDFNELLAKQWGDILGGLWRSLRKGLFATLVMAAVFLNQSCDNGRPEIDLSKRQDRPGPQSSVKALRIAVGAMITPKSGFSYYRDFIAYLEEKIDLPLEYVDKESYAEINAMLRDGDLDLAFVCSGPYVDGAEEFGLQPLVAPQAYGKSVYHSYIIVPKDSSVTSFAGLRGKKFAFTDPQSNTGTLVPTYMLARQQETPDSFFQSYVYTNAHDMSIKAVAMKLVDGAAVDSLIWEYAARTAPVYTSETKVIHKSPPYGIPPVVVRPGLDTVLVEKLRQAFLTAHEDERGREILAGMMVEKFKLLDNKQYDSVRQMKSWLATKRAE